MSIAPPSTPAPPRSRPPLRALGLAILLGAAAALLSPFGHAHGEGGGYFHSHGFAGPHSHGPEPAGEPPPATADEDARILVLAFAARLDAAPPVVARAEASLRLAPPLPPSRPAAAVRAAPWPPRGPPAFPC